MTMYTREMALAMRRIKKPVPVTVDIADDGTQLNVLVYESEYKSLSVIDQMSCMEYLFDVACLLESYGPKVNIQGVPGVPRRL